MTATNHALTGALIGLTVHNPWAALPVALLSHLVCDALPHFDAANATWIAGRRFKFYLALDISLCMLLVALLFASSNQAWVLAALCAFTATLPDFIWLRQFIIVTHGKVFQANMLERFLINIQWFAKPIGAVVELTWFIGAITLLVPLVYKV